MPIDTRAVAAAVFKDSGLEQETLHTALSGGLHAFGHWLAQFAPEPVKQADLAPLFEDARIISELSYLEDEGINPRRLASRFNTLVAPDFDSANGWVLLEVIFLSTATGLELDLDAKERMLTGKNQVGPSVVGYLGRLQATQEKLSTQFGDIQDVENVVSGIQINLYQGQAAKAKPIADPLQQAYLDELFKTCNRINWEGIDLEGRDAGGTRLDLEAVYVPMTAVHRLEEWDAENRIGSFQESLMPLVSVLDQRDRLLLIGEMGSGKSTVIDFICLCLAGEALHHPDATTERLRAEVPGSDDKPSWSQKAGLPVRLELKAFARSGQELREFLAAEVERLSPGFAVALSAAFRDEGGFLFLDGLDEVPEGEPRKRVIAAVERYAQEHKKVRILVSSRPYAVDSARWQTAGFSSATLRPFNTKQIDAYIEQWYPLVAAKKGFTNSAARIADFKACLRNNKSVADFATRPILLVLMASLHSWRGGTGQALPDKRHLLYADAVDMLIERWVRGKDMAEESEAVAEGLRLGKRHLVPMLAELAHEVHGTMELNPDEPCADIDHKLLRAKMWKHLDKDYQPKRLIEFLRMRSGILVDRHEGKVLKFPHRSIQEYLAAWHLTPEEEDSPPKLDCIASLGRSDPGRWREVVQLAAARLPRDRRIALVHELLADGEVEHLEWGGYLAGQIALESLDAKEKPLGKQLHEPLQQRMLASLRCGLPDAERVQCGRVLGHLGDPRYDPGNCHLLVAEDHGFVWIDGGSVDLEKRYGRSADDIGTVDVPGFWIHRHPVTAAMFQRFLENGCYTGEQHRTLWVEAAEAGRWTEGGIKEGDRLRQAPVHYHQAVLPNEPVVGITWYEALAYCRWLSLQSLTIQGQAMKFHLPTTAQWQLAASGGKRIYPWGDDWDPSQLYSDGWRCTAGCFSGDTPDYGLQDCAGNVLEWAQEHDILGGNDKDWARCASRDWYHPSIRNGLLGFRVVASPSSGL